MSNYTAKANAFAKKHGLKLEVVDTPTFKKHFADDKSARWVYKMKLSRSGKSYTFNFGQSYVAGKKTPTMYDVLATLQKNDVGSYENFLSEFGYPKNASSKKTYNAVLKEYDGVKRVLGDVIDELQEIQ